VQTAFGQAVKEANLKVAGPPRIEQKPGGDAPATQALEFSATFEIYPEVKIGDLAARAIERPQVSIDDAAVERTIQVLRKQRTVWSAATRPSKDGDRLTVSYEGRIGGEPFEGGSGAGTTFVLGEGRMLAALEAGVRGGSAGEGRTFDVEFPADYAGKQVAGKTASFSATVTQVEEPSLPEVDPQFARGLGIEDGDVGKMRAEVKANVEREVAKRVEARVKEQVLQAVLEVTPLDLPKSLVDMEMRQIAERAAADLRAQGLKTQDLPLDPQALEAMSRRRVALGIIFAEIARAENLQPKPAQVRALIEQEAQSYDNPSEVVKWFYMQPQRLSEIESIALEANVVGWVLGKAQVVDKAVPFDELMGSA